MTDSSLPSSHEKQKANDDDSTTAPINNGQVKMADTNASSVHEKQQVKLSDSDVSAALERQKIIGTATSDMQYRVNLFNRLTYTCLNKCIDKGYKEGELHLGESTCVDRCVAKYNQVNNIIGHMLASGKYRG